jgi:hypothetical protein
MAMLPQSTLEESLSCKVIARPTELGAEHVAELRRQMVELSVLATCQGELSYRPAVDGWSRYYTAPGNGPSDYARLSLVYANGDLVSLAALKLMKTRAEPSVDIIWLQLTLTAPEYQRTTATVRALSQLLIDPAFQGELHRGYLVVRTPNPLVYEAARRLRTWLNKRGILRFQLVIPTIQRDGSISPMPEEHKDKLNEIVSMISRPENFNPDTFVVSGYYRAFGELYKNYNFRCKNEEVRSYFARNVQCATQDGLFIAIHFENRALGAESRSTTTLAYNEEPGREAPTLDPGPLLNRPISLSS